METVLRVLVAAALLGAAAPAQAKWWVFGKGSDNPELRRVFIAGVDVESVSGEMVLNRESLESGEVEVKGFSAKGGAPVALAEVSLDGGQSWSKAELGRGGTFVFRFKPLPERAYELAARVMDSGGKRSAPGDVPALRLTYKDVSVAEPVKDALRALVRAYAARDRSRFMEWVSLDFRGDLSELEAALEEDFRRLSNITVDPVVDSVVAAGPEAKLTGRFDWRATDQATGSPVTLPQASSVLAFRLEEGRWKLVEMAAPPPFGVSRASRIATGAGTETETGAGLSQFDSGGGEQGPVTLASDSGAGTAQGFNFETGEVVDIAYGGGSGGTDMAFESNILWFGGSGGAEPISTGANEAPASGYANPAPDFGTGDPLLAAGQRWAVYTQAGKYAVITVTGFVDGSRLSFTYRYNPDGSRSFP